MNFGAPLLDVATSMRGALLHALTRLERPVTRRQLASAAGVAPGNASRVIADLIDAGIVTETEAGRSSMVQLNREHLAAAPIVALAGLRGELIRRLRERLGMWPDVVGAWLFGSLARGDADRDSDIDVLIITADPQSAELHDRLSRLTADVRTWTGNEVQFVEHSSDSWRKLMQNRSPLVEQIRADGIVLAGDRSLLERRR